MTDSDKRLKYYNGQFLRQEDFIEEQAYHLDRLRRHLRQLHTPGIAEGLTVTADVGDSEVTVQPGTAIDNEGRPIVLVAPRTVSVGTAVGKPVLVVITYRERPAVPATVGDEKDTRWLEDPEVEVIPESGAPPTDLHIRLARLHLDSESRIEAPQDTSVRTSAGTRLGTEVEIERVRLSRQGVAAHLWPVLSSGAPDQADVAGNLAVAGKVLVEGNSPHGPVTEINNTGDEASIRYLNARDNYPWHVGTGGLGGNENFFFWNPPHGIVATITPDGTLTTKGRLNVLSGTKDKIALTVESGLPGPAMEVHSTAQEASVRYLNSDNEAWHVGTGGAGGPKNFFFWNSTNGAVSAIEPDGALTTKGSLSVGSGTKDKIAFTVDGNISASPVVEVRSKGNEASIRYANKDNVPWHVGTGGIGGEKNFFFWNPTNGVVSTIEPDGTLTTKGRLNVLSGTKDKIALTLESGLPGPAMEVHGTAQEASIRYLNSDNEAWHVGTGGAGGLKNFFFWNSTNGAVSTITPDGSVTMRGSLNVGGGTKDKLALKIEGDRVSPLVEINNKNNESLIRFVNNDNEPWHVGTGGLSGPRNFGFWNQTNGVVATITPEGNLTIKGNLVVGGGLQSGTGVTVEKALTYRDGSQSAGHVLTSDAGGRATWKSIGPVFIPPVVVGSGVAGFKDWTPYDLPSPDIPSGVRAVILEVQASKSGPEQFQDGRFADAWINIRPAIGGPVYVLLRSRASGGGDNISLSNQGMFPVHNNRFEYRIEYEGFEDWTIRVVGYFP